MVVYEKIWCRSLDRNWDWIFKTTLMDNHFKTICGAVRTECSSAWWSRLYPKARADPGYPGGGVNPKGGGFANLLFDQIILKTGWIWRKFYNEDPQWIYFHFPWDSEKQQAFNFATGPHNYENISETKPETFVYVFLDLLMTIPFASLQSIGFKLSHFRQQEEPEWPNIRSDYR